MLRSRLLAQVNVRSKQRPTLSDCTTTQWETVETTLMQRLLGHTNDCNFSRTVTFGRLPHEKHRQQYTGHSHHEGARRGPPQEQLPGHQPVAPKTTPTHAPATSTNSRLQAGFKADRGVRVPEASIGTVASAPTTSDKGVPIAKSGAVGKNDKVPLFREDKECPSKSSAATRSPIDMRAQGARRRRVDPTGRSFAKPGKGEKHRRERGFRSMAHQPPHQQRSR